MNIIPAELIKAKKLGKAHSQAEINWLIENFTSGELPDYQMAAWAMAVYFKGMSGDETAWLTAAMRDSGKKYDFSYLNAPRIDKHSTGGVGDKTSLILGPILAAAEVYTPMIAGRGLGHTGGTLDKLESIPGFRVSLTNEEYQKNVENHYYSIMGQTDDVCPADKKLYSLRDVTATVDSLPLICGSIMSKKLAEDLSGLVLDVKFGSGAFMKTLEDAETLAKLLKTTGEKNGVKVHAVLSNMNEPLGRFSGNACEIKECVDILRGEKCIQNDIDWYEPTRRLSLILSGHMLFLGEMAETPEAGIQLATDILESGEAWTAFEKLLEYQGPSKLSDLPEPKHQIVLESPRAGYFSELNTEQLGMATIELGVGRKKSTDSVDYAAGIEHLAHPGDKLEKGQPLYRLFNSTGKDLEEARDMALEAITLTESSNQSSLPLVAKVLT